MAHRASHKYKQDHCRTDKKWPKPKIILSNKFNFCTPQFGVAEVKKYKNLIKEKSALTEENFNYLMPILLSKITVYSEKDISKKSIEKATKIMKNIDADDVVFIALCIELENKPIWTDDNHFQKQNQIKVFSTNELSKML